MPAVSASEFTVLAGFAPNWPAPVGVRAFCAHQNVDSAQLPGDYRLETHRALLQSQLGIAPFWLKQTHSVDCINISDYRALAPPTEADASYFCGEAGVVPAACVILTADCLPILLCSLDGQEIAAIHAGWRGLAAGVIESALRHFRAPASQIMAWLGPAISGAAFEVGPEVRNAFLTAMPDQCEQTAAAFVGSADLEWVSSESVNTESLNSGHFFADLYQLARLRFHKQGVNRVYGGDFCTVNDRRFHSFRRDGNESGRMATLIWLAKH